jgi:hypothetical protein
MRKVSMVRLGIATAVATLGVAGVIASGCSGDDNNGPPAPGPDGGSDTGSSSDTSTPTTDTGTGTKDTGTTDTGPGGPGAQLILIHAAPGVPPIRLCFANIVAGKPTVVLTPAPDAPTPPQAGLMGIPAFPPGAIGAFSPVGSGVSVATYQIRPFLINAMAIANDVNFDGGNGVNTTDGGPEETCADLIGADGTGGRLKLGQDYWQLPDIMKGMLQDGKTYMLPIVGCVGGDPGGVAKCGSTFTDGGNVNYGLAALDTTTPAPDGGIGVQFANFSSAVVGESLVVGQLPDGGPLLHGPASLGVVPSMVALQADGGITTAIVGDGGPVGYDPNVITPLTQLPIDPAAIAAATDGGLPLFTAIFTPGGAGGIPDPTQYPGHPTFDEAGAPTGFELGDLFALPLNVVAALSQWSASATGTPPTFSAGQNYTFVLVGNPTANPLTITLDSGAQIPNPGYVVGYGPHFVAFPNKFMTP